MSEKGAQETLYPLDREFAEELREALELVANIGGDLSGAINFRGEITTKAHVVAIASRMIGRPLKGATSSNPATEAYLNALSALERVNKDADEYFGRMEAERAERRRVEMQLERAWSELHCCDDVKLDGTLPEVIGYLVAERDAQRNRAHGLADALDKVLVWAEAPVAHAGGADFATAERMLEQYRKSLDLTEAAVREANAQLAEAVELLRVAVENLEQTLRFPEGWECSEDELLGDARAFLALEVGRP